MSSIRTRAAWLRNLNGDVDERSITDVAPDLAGIGGWPAALRLAGLARRPAGLDGIVSLPAVHTTCWINCGLEASLLLMEPVSLRKRRHPPLGRLS
jgi:hypothetical protein